MTTESVKGVSFPAIRRVTAVPNSSSPQIRVRTPLWRSLLVNETRFAPVRVGSEARNQAAVPEFPGGLRGKWWWGQQGKGCGSKAAQFS